jgi:hypothetical protein
LLRKEVADGWTVFVVTGGFALVNNDVVTILVNEAEFGSLRSSFILIIIAYNFAEFLFFIM